MSEGGSTATCVDSGVGTGSSDSLTRGAGSLSSAGGGRGYGAVRDSSAEGAPSVGWANDAPPAVSPSSSRYGWDNYRVGDAACLVSGVVFLLVMVTFVVVLLVTVKPEPYKGPPLKVHDLFDGRL